MGCPDVGCGRGAVTWELARRAGTTGRAVGIDIDRTVLELARHEAERDGAWAIEYHEADVLTAELAPEYDAIYAQQSTVTFSYVFGSEEYSNYANTGFNDVFGFFVNGTNCALVPGTTDPVSVNTINNGNDAGGDTTPHHPELFRDNVNPSPSIDSQLDGLTTVLTCTASVTAGQTNHIELAIADVGDSGLDSAVFIQAGSLVSGNVLTVTKNGTGSGSVTSSPAGIDCSPTCTDAFTGGTVVTLTPTASTGSTFAGWSGACSGTGTCTVTMDQARNVTATFNAIPTFALTVNKTGTGGGTVTSSPAGIDCGATCSRSFTSGTVVTLTAIPADGSTFAGWTGACSGTGQCMVTVDQVRSVTATFNSLGLGGPPSVNANDLFCGVQHRGRCTGLKVKGIFERPGNAVWTFDAYNPNPGRSTASAAAARKLRLGSIKRAIKQAGTVRVVFKLRPGARTNRLYRLVRKRKLNRILVKLTFATTDGYTQTKRKRIKLKF